MILKSKQELKTEIIAECRVESITPKIVSYPPAKEAPSKSSSGEDDLTAKIL